MQCRVEMSSLHVPAKISKVQLQGFYDPVGRSSRIFSLRLGVRYLFRGKLHQVVVSDKQELKIPMKAHIIDAAMLRKSHSTQNTKRRICRVQRRSARSAMGPVAAKSRREMASQRRQRMIAGSPARHSVFQESSSLQPILRSSTSGGSDGW